MTDTVLIATLGSEPQVITLCLDKLLYDHVAIRHVVVVHTLPDREPVRASLARLHQEFQVNRSYGDDLLFVPHLLAGPAGPLADVVTPEEIEVAFQSFYTLLRQHKHAGRTVHLNIAGGRKTVALFVMAAAQILLGPGDQVWHVVSPPALVESRALHADDPNAVTLVPVPVVRWRQITPESARRAEAFVREALSPAERELVTLLVREGLSNAALAQRLEKSPKTIANQLSSIYAKLGDHFELDSPPDRAALLVLLGSYS